MNKFYRIMAEIDSAQEELYGSFVRDDCVYEMDAEKESWKGQGYRKIKITTEKTTKVPDKEVYAEQYAAGIFK